MIHNISVDDETLGFMINHFNEHFKNLDKWLDDNKDQVTFEFVRKNQEKQICDKLINQLEKVECE